MTLFRTLTIWITSVAIILSPFAATSAHARDAAPEESTASETEVALVAIDIDHISEETFLENDKAITDLPSKELREEKGQEDERKEKQVQFNALLDEISPEHEYELHPLDGLLDARPDESSGALVFQVPIESPPGRNGVQPNIALTYNSSNHENGPFGYGWSLNIPTISRMPDQGLQDIYDDGFSEFTSSFDGELLPIDTTFDGEGQYAARIEHGAFYEYHFSGTAWTVKDKFGGEYYFSYGDSVGSDIQGMHTWTLSNYQDSNGNKIYYTYTKANGAIYPSNIEYTKWYGESGAFTIDFLTENRTDKVEKHNKGFSEIWTKRVDTILVKAFGQTVRRYDLQYTSGDNDYKSLLSEVQQKTYAENGGGLITIEPDAFVYTKNTSGSKGWQKDTSYTIPVPFFNAIEFDVDNGVRIIDVNGDGFDDILHSVHNKSYKGPSHKDVYINKTDGTGWELDPSYEVPVYFVDWDGHDNGARIADLNGDGLPDILKHDGNDGAWGYVYMNKGDGTGWELDTSYQIPIGFLDEDELDHGVRIAEVNGDGFPDLIQAYTAGPASSNIGIYVNKADGTGWEFLSTFAFFPPSSVRFNEPGFRVADVNNDGLDDFLYFEENEDPEVYIHHGFDQNFATGDINIWKIDPNYELPQPFVTEDDDEFEDNGVRILDVNGDGFNDIVWSLLNDDKKVYINKADGSGWEEDSGYNETNMEAELYDTSSHVTLTGDVDGDGLVDFLRSSKPAFGQTAVHINKAKKPDMLYSVAYSSGGTLDVSYEPSTAFTDNSGNLLNPNLPMVMYLVEEMGLYDGYSATPASLINYTYIDGELYHDEEAYHDNRFAGFWKITAQKQYDQQVSKYYHQGNDVTFEDSPFENVDSYARIGLPYLSQVSDNGSLLHRRITQWQVEDIGTFDNEDRLFVHQFRSGELEYNAAGQYIARAKTYVHDSDNGNLLKTYIDGTTDGAGLFFNYALPEDDAYDYLKTTDYILESDFHRLEGLPSIEKTLLPGGILAQQRWTFYDDFSDQLGKAQEGNVSRITDFTEEGIKINTYYTYNPYGLVTSEKNPNGHTTNFSYDEHYLYQDAITNPLGHTTEYTYDYSSGIATKTIDANGVTIAKTTLDSRDRPVAVYAPSPTKDGSEDATVLLREYTYTDTGLPRVVVEKNAAEQISTHTYIDGLERILQVKRQQSIVYVTEKFSYDANGRISTTWLPYWTNTPSYQPATGPSELATQNTYDGLGRKTQEVIDGKTTSYVYDKRVATVTDPMGNIRTYAYDGLGNLSTVEEHNEGDVYTTSYKHNWRGQVTNITDAQSNTKTFVFDYLGRLLSMEQLHADGATGFGEHAYAYDSNSNLVSVTDPKGQTLSYTFDELNRKTSETLVGDEANTAITYTYDSCLNGVGRLCSVDNGVMSTSYSYTKRGDVADTTQNIDDLSLTTSFAYDNLSRMQTLTYPDDSHVDYTYFWGNTLSSVSFNDTPVAQSIVYAQNGSVDNLSFPLTTGETVFVKNTYDNDELYRLEKRKTTIGDTVLQHLEYAYDPIGNITEIADYSDAFSFAADDNAPSADITADGNVNVTDVQCAILLSLWILNDQDGPPPSCFAYEDLSAADLNCSGDVNVADVQIINAKVLGNPLSENVDADQDGTFDACQSSSTESLSKLTTFSYDDLYRLTSSVVTDAASGENYSRSYAYDAIGNMTMHSEHGTYSYGGIVATYVHPHAVDAIQQADSTQTFAYDQNMNLTNDGEATYTWDHKDRMSSVTADDISLSFFYDHQNMRVKKVNELTGKTGYTISPYYDIIDGVPTRHIFAGDMRVASIEGVVADVDNRVIHLTDHLSSASVDVSSDGQVLQLLDYYPFGSVRLNAQNDHDNADKFTGKEFDDESDLYYYGSRYYNPTIARFMSVDSWEGDLYDPQSLNKFAYTKNNPLFYTDPSGHAADAVIDGAFVTYGVVRTTKNTLESAWDSGWGMYYYYIKGDVYKANEAFNSYEKNFAELGDSSQDLAIDGGMFFIPGASTYGVNHIDDFKDVQKVSDDIADIVQNTNNRANNITSNGENTLESVQDWIKHSDAGGADDFPPGFYQNPNGNTITDGSVHLHNDLNHKPPKQPHWGFNDKANNIYIDINAAGNLIPKPIMDISKKIIGKVGKLLEWF